MKQYCNILFLIIMSLNISACKEKTRDNYYIIKSDDAPEYQITYDKKGNSIPPKFKPFHSIVGGIYARIVIIFDSINNVYIYQTKFIKNEPILNCTENDRTKYQNFIHLNPQHLIHFTNKTFIPFIKDNNSIFLLDTVSKEIRTIYIASNMDTIRNPTFYELIKLISKKDYRNKIYYDVRKTTEEENNVLYCKKKNIDYNPSNFKWSDSSLVSKYMPNTKQYDSIEKIKYSLIVRATTTFSIKYDNNE